jgi:hypothetical protein
MKKLRLREVWPVQQPCHGKCGTYVLKASATLIIIIPCVPHPHYSIHTSTAQEGENYSEGLRTSWAVQEVST